MKQPNTSKLCALCDTHIVAKSKVCSAHRKDYEQYKNEQWFIELVKAQETQYTIDKKECVTISKLSETTLSTYLDKVSTSSNVIDKAQVIEMYKGGMRAHQIAKKLHANRYTVTKIIYRYRKSGQNN